MSWSLLLLSPSSASFEEESTSTASVFKTTFPDLIAISTDFDEDSFVRPFFMSGIVGDLMIEPFLHRRYSFGGTYDVEE
ncbi:hypothetical protein AXF42_Ash003805 [Apostasia shenzhenica]|uniref:Uncharacterized protein n=1 Tax=Apostasia shenzhenica TaxID=1088818 RepID=A0A2I0AI04_9ASPA|nr:hypothetical protein AXF42_Ash003805 [Apostasia shenzhenica]